MRSNYMQLKIGETFANCALILFYNFIQTSCKLYYTQRKYPEEMNRHRMGMRTESNQLFLKFIAHDQNDIFCINYLTELKNLKLKFSQLFEFKLTICSKKDDLTTTLFWLTT